MTKPLNHESVYLQLEFCNISCFIKPVDIIKLNFKRLEITKKVITKVYIPGNCYAISNDSLVFQLCTNIKFLLFLPMLASIYVLAFRIEPQRRCFHRGRVRSSAILRTPLTLHHHFSLDYNNPSSGCLLSYATFLLLTERTWALVTLTLQPHSFSVPSDMSLVPAQTFSKEKKSKDQTSLDSLSAVSWILALSKHPKTSHQGSRWMFPFPTDGNLQYLSAVFYSSC